MTRAEWNRARTLRLAISFYGRSQHCLFQRNSAQAELGELARRCDHLAPDGAHLPDDTGRCMLCLYRIPFNGSKGWDLVPGLTIPHEATVKVMFGTYFL